jgi:fatty acid desaturase
MATTSLSYGDRIESHFIQPNLREQLQALYKLDNFHGWLAIVEDWLIISIVTTLSIWSFSHIHLCLALLMYVTCTLVIGARQRGLRVLLHESTHGTLFENPHLNFWVGAICCAFPTCCNTTAYTIRHRIHHFRPRSSGDRSFQSFLDQGLGQQIDSFCLPQYALKIIGNTPAFSVKFIKTHMIAPDICLWEKLLCGTFLLACFLGFILLGRLEMVILYWVIPLFTTQQWISSIVRLFQHYPLIFSATSDLTASRNRCLHPAWNLLLGNHSEGLHLIHHLCPQIPFWNLETAHYIMMEDPSYAALKHYQKIGDLLRDIQAGQP